MKKIAIDRPAYRYSRSVAPACKFPANMREFPAPTSSRGASTAQAERLASGQAIFCGDGLALRLPVSCLADFAALIAAPTGGPLDRLPASQSAPSAIFAAWRLPDTAKREFVADED